MFLLPNVRAVNQGETRKLVTDPSNQSQIIRSYRFPLENGINQTVFNIVNYHPHPEPWGFL